jgi:hypothetical protein
VGADQAPKIPHRTVFAAVTTFGKHFSLTVGAPLVDFAAIAARYRCVESRCLPGECADQLLRRNVSAAGAMVALE